MKYLYGVGMSKKAVQRHTQVIIFFILLLTSSSLAKDWREFSSGYEIPDENYCDMPYITKTKDGNWLCTLTTGRGKEGHTGQHVVATISTDKGRTWSPLIDIEPADGPEASWVVPVVIPGGRVYAFYSYNGDEVGHGDPEFALPDGKATYRADMLGWYCYRYSDDNGRTWSEERYRLPMPVAACDRGNQWAGRVQIFWGIDKPKIADGALFFTFTRLGRYTVDNGEGWLYRSENILTERDVRKIAWELLPGGDHGIRKEEFGSIQEEHNSVPLGNNALYCVYRTTMGFPCHCYSFDGGRTWTTPEPMTYSPAGRIIRNPRACPKLWKTSDGKYLFWFHNNGGRTSNRGERYGSRNVAWLSGGKLIDGRMRWSQPEIVRYCSHPLRGCSYPDLLEDSGHFYISATQKTEARVGEVPRELLEGLWQPDQRSEVARNGLALEALPTELRKDKRRVVELAMPRLPSLAEGGGFTVEMWLELPTITRTLTLLSSVDKQGTGLCIRSTIGGTIRFDMGDGIAAADWECDSGVLVPRKTHHVAFVVDGGPKIISVIVDGVLCDGSESEARRYGWGRFLMSRYLNRSDEHLEAHELGDVTGGQYLRINTHYMQAVRIYDRYLRTSEVISNYRAGLRQEE
jgi:hypothetical protein